MSVLRVVKKTAYILSREKKRHISFLVVLMIIGGIMETCSVGLILPFIDALVNIDTLLDKWYVSIICDFLDLKYPFTFLFVAAASIGLLYIVKNAFLIFEFHIQFKFAYNSQAEMQGRIFSAMINRPYEFFLKLKSGEAIRLIHDDIPSVFTMLLQLLFMATEMVVSVMLVATIFFIIPGITLTIAGVLIVMVILVNSIIKPILHNEGEKTNIAASGVNKWLIQAVQGIKEVKIMETEDFFFEKFSECCMNLADSRRKQSVLSYIPRFVIEAVCMASLFFSIAILIISGNRFGEIIPMLSAVAMASIRLLPSVNRISAALSSIAYYEPMLDSVISNITIFKWDEEHNKDVISIDSVSRDKRNGKTCREVACDNTDEMWLKKKIYFHEITYHYPGSYKNILRDTSFYIKRGEAVGIVGESGAGKTTVIDIMLGLLAPQKGRVFLDGRDIHENIKVWHNKIGYIPQMIFMLDDTVRANVVFGRSIISDDQVWEALDDAAIGDFVRRMPNGLDTEIGERGIRLSGGQRQRIGIARALYGNPEILVFDEATSALDNSTEAEVMKSVYKMHGDKTLIIIAHRLSTIELCDRVFKIEEGKIVQER